MRGFVLQKFKLIMRDPAKFFIAAAVLSGVFYVVVSPPGFGLDERAHLLRSYSISKGEFLPKKIGIDKQYGSSISQSLVKFVGTSTMDILDNNQAVFVINRHDTNPKMYEEYKKRKLSEPTQDIRLIDSQVLAAISYSPFGYIHFAIVVFFGNLVNAPLLYIMYAARLVGLAVYIALVWFAIKTTTRCKWLIVAIALLPVAVSQAASISIDPLVNAGSLLLVAAWIKALDHGRVSKQTYWTIIFTLILIALTKFPYIVLIFPFMFLKTSMFNSKKAALLKKGFWILVPVATLMWWLFVSRHITKLIVLLQPGHANTSEQIHYIISHPARFLLVLVRTHYESIDHTLGAMLARSGDRQIGMPNAFMYFFIVLICLVLMAQYQKESTYLRKVRSHNLIFFSGVVGLVVLISTTLFITFTPVGANFIQGIQGRYFIPILPMLMLILLNQKIVTINASRLIKDYGIQVISSTFLFLSFALYYLANY